MIKIGFGLLLALASAHDYLGVGLHEPAFGALDLSLLAIGTFLTYSGLSEHQGFSRALAAMPRIKEPKRYCTAAALLLFGYVYLSNAQTTAMADQLTYSTMAQSKNYLADPIAPYTGDAGMHYDYTHPPLGYYIYSLAFLAFGIKDMTAIYAAIFLTLMTGLATLLLGTRLFSYRTGLAAMSLYLLMPFTYEYSRYTSIDIPLTLSMTLAIYAIYKAANERGRNDFLLAGAAIGASILIKEAAILLCALLAAQLELTKRQRPIQTALIRQALIPVAVAVGLWMLYGGLGEQKEFVNSLEFRVMELGHQIYQPWEYSRTSMLEALHAQTSGIFAALLLGGTALGLKKRTAGDMLLLGYSAIILAFFLFISGARGPRYLLILMPALSIIAGRAVDTISAQGKIGVILSMFLLAYSAAWFHGYTDPATSKDYTLQELKNAELYMSENFPNEVLFSKIGAMHNFYKGGKYYDIPALETDAQEFFRTALLNRNKSAFLTYNDDSDTAYWENPHRLREYISTNCIKAKDFGNVTLSIC